MSTILRALKKAENESSKRPGQLPERPVLSGRKKGLVIGMAVLGVAVGLWIGYLFMRVSPGIESQREGPGEGSSPVGVPGSPVSVSSLATPGSALRQAQDTASPDSATGKRHRRDKQPETGVGEKRAMESGTDGLDLSGVIYDQDHPVAIINGNFVGVGDSIAGAKIIGIERDKVRVSFGGEERTIKVNQ